MTQALEVMSVQGVRGYLDEKGIAWLNVEDCARGLGFVDTHQKKDFATSGEKYETVRWARVNGYLREFGYDKDVGKDDFIPENMFYRLAMKASNAAAQKFQAKVCDEILPSIRKHGVYATQDFLSKTIADPTWAIGVLTALKEAQDKAALLEVENQNLSNQVTEQAEQIEEQILQLEEQKPAVDYYHTVLQSPDLVPVTIIFKDYGVSAITGNRILEKKGIQYKINGTWVLKQEYSGLKWTQTKTHVYQDKSGIEHTKQYTCWTQLGRLGIYNLLKKDNILPVCEQPEDYDIDKVVQHFLSDSKSSLISLF